MGTLTRGEIITFTDNLVIEECCNCHINFAMPVDLQKRARADESIWFYCPLGHHQHYPGKTAVQKAQERAERLERQLANEREYSRSVYAEKQAEKQAHAVTKGKLTKTRNRAEKGVCLHCNRSFVNVQRHVSHMHPAAGE